MTAKDFAAKLTGYFGQNYLPGQKPEVLGWILSVPEYLFTSLWQATLRQPLYGRPLPLISDLETALKQAREAYEVVYSHNQAAKALALPDEPLATPEAVDAAFDKINAKLGINLFERGTRYEIKLPAETCVKSVGTPCGKPKE